MLRTPLVALLAFWIGSGPAFAGPPVSPKPVEKAAGDSVETPAKEPRRALFPPFRKSRTEAKSAAAVTAAVSPTSQDQVVAQRAETGPNPEAPAEDLPGTDDAPAEGIWEWVGRMEGEIPSNEQVEAIEEVSETELAERALIDELSAAPPPKKFYKDPVAAVTADPLHLDRVDPSEFDIPIVVNDEVRKWVVYFTGPGRKYYQRWLGRSTRYRPMMYKELDKAGLPRDLVYLSMIESGYNAHAYSHAAAAGLWQFIPSTARLYKMRVDWWVDDRRDPERSLEAAIDFLGELHQMFDDWPLAWASYNTGPGRVRRAVSKSGTRDFYTIARGPYLHPKTENYVPKIMAAAIIGHHPERYGFTDIKFQEELEYETARVEGSVELGVLAKCAGIKVDEIKALNPALRRYATPPEGYDVRLPVGTGARFLVALAKVPKSQRVTVVRHTVKRGETLSVIAARYGVGVNSLSQANNLRNVNRIYVGMTLVVPKHGAPAPTGTSTAKASTSSPSKTAKKSSPAKPSTYTVGKGDTLSVIAAKYGTSVKDIQSRNGLSGSTIHVGQTLKLTGSAAQSSSSQTTTAKYTVRRGDTLSSIATKYGVGRSDLQKWNGISNASHIEVGQVLKVRTSSTSWKTHTVASGDSLGGIASRNNCSVSQLREWNGLSGSVIHPGQKIKIRVN